MRTTLLTDELNDDDDDDDNYDADDVCVWGGGLDRSYQKKNTTHFLFIKS